MTTPGHVVLCEKRFPLPPDHGRAMRVITLARGLRGLGFRVTVLACQGAPSTLEDGTRIRTIPPLPWPLRELVLWSELRRIHREARVDVFQVENDIFVLVALLARVTGFRVRYDAQVVEADFWSAARAQTLWDLASSKIMPTCERIVCRLSDRVSALGDHDARRLEELHGLSAAKVSVIPLSIQGLKETAEWSERPSPRPVVVFLGSYDHRPNADAIDLIADEIRPRVLRQVPAAVFRIVGKGLPVGALEARGLEAQSNVAEVTSFLDDATVCIAPVRVGSGVRTKLLEYLSRGKPVVAMSPALEGLPVRPGTDLLVADDLEAFADRVAVLLQDSALRKRIGTSGLERIRELTGRDVMDRALTAFYLRA